MNLKRLFTFLGAFLVLALTIPAQTVRVLFVDGEVTIQPTKDSSPRPLQKGDSLSVGAVIKTGADGRVMLTPMPGAHSVIVPNSVLTLEEATEKKQGQQAHYSAQLHLERGVIASDLNKPANTTYDYRVRTPRGVAGARGTSFLVGILNGSAYYLMLQGSIGVTSEPGDLPQELSAPQGMWDDPTAKLVTILFGNASQLPPGVQEDFIKSVRAALDTTFMMSGQFGQELGQFDANMLGALNYLPLDAALEMLQRQVNQSVTSGEALAPMLARRFEALERVLSSARGDPSALVQTLTRVINEAVDSGAMTTESLSKIIGSTNRILDRLTLPAAARQQAQSDLIAAIRAAIDKGILSESAAQRLAAETVRTEGRGATPDSQGGQIPSSNPDLNSGSVRVPDDTHPPYQM